MIRRRRCQYLVIAVIALQLVVISLIGTQNSDKLLPLKDLTNSLRDYAVLLQERNTFPFDAWADKIFRNYLEDQTIDNKEIKIAALSVNSSAYGADETAVQLPSFFKDDTENPILLPFEPHLTLGMILNEYNEQLRASGGPNPSTFDFTLPVFHWADWTDLSALYPHFMSAGENRQTCELFGRKARKTRKNPNPKASAPDWCMDDSNIAYLYHENIVTDEKKRGNLKEILQSPLRTGFHVDQYGGRTPHAQKRLEAASFLNDFMDKPLSVVLLMPVSSGRLRSIRLNVNQEVGSRVRLLHSELAKSVSSRVNKVDVRDELRYLAMYYEDVGTDAYEPTLELQHEDFMEDLRVRLKELSKKESLTAHERNYAESLALSVSGVEPTKYLYEAQLHKSTPNWAWGSHYDWRFYKSIINFSDLQAPALHSLTRAWLRFIDAQRLNSWVAHGTLLSWYWSGINFPWDADVDVQMPISDLHKLARDFNQSVIVDFGNDVEGEIKTGRYFLDIGTWISLRDFGNGRNNIDARFIDMDTGLYIDITGLAITDMVAPKEYDRKLPRELRRTNKDRSMDELEIERNTYLKVYNCRNKHFASLKDLSPMKLTYVEGVPAYVPNNYMLILQQEYNEGGLVDQKFKRYVFLPRLRIWHPFDKVSQFVLGKGKHFSPVLELGPDKSKALSNIDKMAVYTMSDEDYLELMVRERLLLVEYITTRDVTALHQKEMEKLFKNKLTKSLLFENDKLKYHFPSMRRDFLKYARAKEDFLFEQKVDELTQEMILFRKGVTRDVDVEEDGGEEPATVPTPAPVNTNKNGPNPVVMFQPVGAAPVRPMPNEI